MFHEGADYWPAPTREDIDYLLRATEAALAIDPIRDAEIVSLWSGVRPLIAQAGKKANEVSRKDEIWTSPAGLVSIAGGKLSAYRAMAEKASEVFRDYGATRVVEAWGDDVPDGKVTDYSRAAHRQDGETVVFSWIEWPSREARVAAWDRIMADDRMKHDPNDQTFDGKRMIYGGFAPIVEA